MKTRIMMITVAALLLIGAGAHASDVEAYTSTGTVEMAKKGSSKWMPLMPGGLIEPGYTVRCGADGSAVLRWFSGNVVRLAPGATLTIDKVSDAGGVYESMLNLSKGRVYVRAEKLPGAKSSFQVMTPTATAGVRGTEFMAEVSSDAKKSSFAVMDGQILVEAKSITVILDRDFQISVDQDQPPGEIFNITSELKVGLQNDSQLVNQAATNMPVVVSAPKNETTASTQPAAAEPVTVASAPRDVATNAGIDDTASGENSEKSAAQPTVATTETKPADTAAKPAETKPAEAAPVETKPAEVPPPETAAAKTEDKSKDKPAETKTETKAADKPDTKTPADTAAQPKKDEKKPEAAPPAADKKKDQTAQPKKDEKKPAAQNKESGAKSSTQQLEAIDTLVEQILDYELFNYIVDNVMMP